MKKMILFLTLLFALNSCDKNEEFDNCPDDTTKYLVFQYFSFLGAGPSSPDNPEAPSFHPRSHLESFVAKLKMKIGEQSCLNRKYGVMVGPITLDHSKEEIEELIKSSFEIAIDNNLAIGFHLDDGMYWAKRDGLWSNPENVEWTDWQGTLNEGRFVDWIPVKLAPHMCFNCPEVMQTMESFMQDIGSIISNELDKLSALNKSDLFSGVIVGWETSLDEDFDTRLESGYHALTNKGFSANNPPDDVDKERTIIVKEYIDFLSQSIINSGLPREKIYCHIAFISRPNYNMIFTIDPDFEHSYEEINNFGVPEIAIGDNYNPGFSTYFEGGKFEQIRNLNNGNMDNWCSAEAANISLAMPPNPSGISMESYLAKHFNYGANMVTMFAFDVRGDEFTNIINESTEGEEAIQVYKKFLKGEKLAE